MKDEVSGITERHLERANLLGHQRATQRLRHGGMMRDEQMKRRETTEEILEDLDPHDLWFAVKGDKFPTNPKDIDTWSLDLLVDAYLDGYEERYDNHDV